jgi:hypothetical protein
MPAARRHADRGAVLLGPAGTALEQQAAVCQRTVLRRTAQQMHLRRGQLGAMQPPTRLFRVGRASAPIGDFARGAVQHDAVHKADHPGIGRIDRQDRMQEQAETVAIAACAETAFAGRVSGKMQLHGVFNRQRVPPGNPLAGLVVGGCQHLVHRHRRFARKRPNWIA